MTKQYLVNIIDFVVGHETNTKTTQTTAKHHNDAWLSLVERCVRDAEAAGSNPVASTVKTGTRMSSGFFVVVRISRTLCCLMTSLHQTVNQTVEPEIQKCSNRNGEQHAADASDGAAEEQCHNDKHRMNVCI